MISVTTKSLMSTTIRSAKYYEKLKNVELFFLLNVKESASKIIKTKT